jgi:hypothetical protein
MTAGFDIVQNVGTVKIRDKKVKFPAGEFLSKNIPQAVFKRKIVITGNGSG